MIKVKNENDLLSVLRIVASEAVSLSKQLKENKDPSIVNYKKQYAMDSKIYGDLSEIEEENEEVEESEEENSSEENSSEDSKENTPNTPNKSDITQKVDAGRIGASFDSVVQAVNSLRAGKSLRDTSIKQQAQIYYDKLTDAERTTLLIYLEALANIIAGQVDGAEAQDPSDPPASIDIISKNRKIDKTQVSEPTIPEEPTETETEEPVISDKAEDSTEEQEDTTPPIKVNESQDVTILRKKVRRMMLRG